MTTSPPHTNNPRECNQLAARIVSQPDRPHANNPRECNQSARMQTKRTPRTARTGNLLDKWLMI
jgi:hypothetical protein